MRMGMNHREREGIGWKKDIPDYLYSTAHNCGLCLCHREEYAGNSSSQSGATKTGRLVERQSPKRGSQDKTTRHCRKWNLLSTKKRLRRTLQNEGREGQERTLNWQHKTRFKGTWPVLGGSTEALWRQRRLQMSMCGPFVSTLAEPRANEFGTISYNTLWNSSYNVISSLIVIIILSISMTSS